MKKIAIAIDGPAGAGKSTIAKIIAAKLGITYVDTGAMYRAVTLSIIEKNIDLNNIEKIKNLISSIDIYITDNKIYLDGIDVSEKIRDPNVNKLVSQVSAIPCIREKLVELQRKIAKDKTVIMDGRDIGTNVLKEAEIKIFLTAPVEERAKRRYLELIKKGYNVDLASVKQDICSRDMLDSNRTLNPLSKANDAVTLDTANKSIENVVDEIINIIKK